MNQPLISPQQLQQRLLAEDNIIILDASIEFQIPSESEKIKGQMIPGAIRFDYDKDFCNKHTLLPHMFPTEKHFNTRAQEIGINQDSTIVVYDNAGTFASPRAWWMFMAMGHNNVYILDGGLPAWIEAGYTTETDYRTEVKTGNFEGHIQDNYFVSAQQVESYSTDKSANIVDARSQARFDSEVPEPREGLRSGHIPNSVCLPFAQVLNDGKLRTQQELIEIFSTIEITPSQPMFFSCGSGVTACIILLAAKLAGYTGEMGVYDGSWTEWGANEKLPIAVTEK
ncbi:sulfurtransferase [Vibrio splendidus]|uniref:sulfurtransferase n=1 Tax=Vibrio splendidus TaxID=29497 RepID=UPI000D384CAF|nr:sulfurtransferase [Vibrio splendidus]MCQ8865750.1 sulfurtransferase [Vibrio splendidus]PTO57323.1 sulfurtransferase [Vibrio splendidus]PTO99901.1 sulfurtransferase [Vibrio splendidus]PTQ09698.1 sulfurtransferase [Vibrio splendidus]